MKTEARYITVKKHILNGIRQHLWLEGERVSSENVLVADCNVSRMTARRAIKELTLEGVLYSKQGQGTFVASAKSRSSVMKIQNIANEIHERNHQHSCKVLCLEQQTNPEVAIRIGLAAEDLIYFSRVIHFEDNIAIQLEDRFVNPCLAPDYIKQDFNNLTANEYLTKICPVSEAEHQVEAVMPSYEQTGWLELSPNEPCLKVTRTVWSDAQIASFAYLYHPGSRFQLGSHIKMNEENYND